MTPWSQWGLRIPLGTTEIPHTSIAQLGENHHQLYQTQICHIIEGVSFELTGEESISNMHKQITL